MERHESKCTLSVAQKAGRYPKNLTADFWKEGKQDVQELIARRQFTPTYIWLDIAFLLFFISLLLFQKKYMTVLVGFLMGMVYMAVDYGVFHLVCHARSITGGSLFWVLLWMSMSYGFTNFAWIWLWISKDRHLFEWSFLILSWWFCCPMIANTFSAGQIPIVIQRTTGAYHGYMAILLFVGYAGLIVYNLAQKDQSKRAPIPWLLTIGILVQFGWEAGLLLGGIRSAGFASLAQKLSPLVINSLLETNLGMPYIYLIFIAVTSRFTEQFQRRTVPLRFTERICENNGETKKAEKQMP